MCMIKRKVSEVVIEIPIFQRISDINHINEIFEDIKKNIMENSRIILPGCTIFAKSPEKIWIMDGIHRMEVYKRILKELNIDLDVYCHEIEVKNEEEARALFYKINNTRMLPEMPEGFDISKVKTITTYLSGKYPKIFSNSKTGRVCRPHIHFNGLQEALAKINNIPSDAIQRIESFNSQVMNIGFSQILQNEDVSSLVESANKKGGFYLGIIGEYRWLDILFGGGNILASYKKKSIPQKLRLEVWKKYNKEIEGKCYICKGVICIDNFHCGHDTPESKGGQTILSNLKPLCSGCNLSMGTQTIEEMMRFFK